jgi:hypothetical protein
MTSISKWHRQIDPLAPLHQGFQQSFKSRNECVRTERSVGGDRRTTARILAGTSLLTSRPTHTVLPTASACNAPARFLECRDFPRIARKPQSPKMMRYRPAPQPPTLPGFPCQQRPSPMYILPIPLATEVPRPCTASLPRSAVSGDPPPMATSSSGQAWPDARSGVGKKCAMGLTSATLPASQYDIRFSGWLLPTG